MPRTRDNTRSVLQKRPLMRSNRRPFVLEIRSKGRTYLYYRRGGERIALPGPEGSSGFEEAYTQAHAKFERPRTSEWAPHTVGDAITAYLASADFHQLAPASQRQYRWALDHMRDRIGHVLMVHIDPNWVDKLRDKLAPDPIRWNSIRSRMSEVWKLYRKRYPNALSLNSWQEAKRLRLSPSDQNRRWPDAVLIAVLREATPHFRALLVTLLLTAQRIGDVVRFTVSQFDEQARVLSFVQQKTGKAVALHVPDILADSFALMKKGSEERLLLTPRGRPWTVVNAEETLLALRTRLGVGRYTLHGLRATGPQALKVLGLENRAIRSLTGHDSDRNLEIYLRGVDGYPMAKHAQRLLEERFNDVLRHSMDGANTRKFAGVTGRAAGKARATAPKSASAKANVAGSESAKPVQNAKLNRV